MNTLKRHMRASNRCSKPALLLIAALLVAASLPRTARAANYGIGACDGDYVHCLETWKAERTAALLGPDGYLNLAGLYWLRPGAIRFGSAPDNDLVFPPNAPAHIGTLTLENGRVDMTIAPGIPVRAGGAPVRQLSIADDTAPQPTVVTLGSLSWTVIRRDGRFAVRLRDFENPSLAAFEAIDYFPTDPALRVSARLEPYPEPRVVRVNTVVAGLDYKPRSPGILHFDIDGRRFDLEAYDAGEEFLIVFGDGTTGRTTYPAGRFLYVPKPGPDGVTTMDFNTAQNPPCAFNEFATCPVASSRNRLKTPIEAGERYDPSGH